MRLTFIALIVLIVLTSALTCGQDIVPDARGYIVKAGDKVTDFELKFLDGSTKKLSELDAEVIVLNFFASWCGVCRKEIPHLEKEIWQPLKDRRLIIIGVDYKEKPEIVEKAKKEIGMTYPIALDSDGKIFEKFARGGVTRNIVLDKNFNIIFLTRLFKPEEFQQMKEAIRHKLGIKDNKLKTSQKEYRSVKKILLQDFANAGKEIQLDYTGQHKIHLEGRIFSVKKNKLEIGVSLFGDDIVAQKYDKTTRTYEIGYRHYKGVRIAILPMTKFEIPAETEKIVVYDVI